MNFFNHKDYLRDLSHELISNFARASRATTPGLIGGARESEVRRQLESILPPGIGVGTGCVIDYRGNASKQQDIILYEKDICPKFSINNSPESTYFPCEGVIAVGEIKSSLGKAEIEDSFQKIKSAKSLKRWAQPSKSILTEEYAVSYRSYLTRQGFDPSLKTQFDQFANPLDQIWGFILCGNFAVKNETLFKHITNQAELLEKNVLPNLILSLDDGFFAPIDKNTKRLKHEVAQGTGYVYGRGEMSNFEYLLICLKRIVRNGRTVDISAFERYFLPESGNADVSIESLLDIRTPSLSH